MCVCACLLSCTFTLLPAVSGVSWLWNASLLLITLVLTSEMDQLVWVAAGMGLLHSGAIHAQK